MQRRIDQFDSAGAQVIGISVDTGNAARLVVQETGATFPILSDPGLRVTTQFDMQLRGGWPMGGMGRLPEMGFVIVDGKGRIRAQRVDLLFGQTAIQMLPILKEMP
ncbi:MAG: redoxin domain-containing protein [Chloroflexi bacterium]|nr:redoxin domain-containing protein [Chloroflexota bacterium]